MASGYFPVWPLNTLVQLADGEEVTVCYNGFDGCGGVYGRLWFEMAPGTNGEDFPAPDVLFRPDDHVPSGHKPGLRIVDVLSEVPVLEWSDGTMESAVWVPQDREQEGLR